MQMLLKYNCAFRDQAAFSGNPLGVNKSCQGIHPAKDFNEHHPFFFVVM
jgi:hypothetical protein